MHQDHSVKGIESCLPKAAKGVIPYSMSFEQSGNCESGCRTKRWSITSNGLSPINNTTTGSEHERVTIKRSRAKGEADKVLGHYVR